MAVDELGVVHSLVAEAQTVQNLAYTYSPFTGRRGSFVSALPAYLGSSSAFQTNATYTHCGTDTSLDEAGSGIDSYILREGDHRLHQFFILLDAGRPAGYTDFGFAIRSRVGQAADIANLLQQLTG